MSKESNYWYAWEPGTEKSLDICNGCRALVDWSLESKRKKFQTIQLRRITNLCTFYHYNNELLRQFWLAQSGLPLEEVCCSTSYPELPVGNIFTLVCLDCFLSFIWQFDLVRSVLEI
ncbi:hypothetical protein T4D_13092 [Trichinella pseudospiralis]|uniref:Uncharacterized protein n=1 Tax=Trichinella pseudospiralis TaxID=6337 RepID=A0A0V1G198_TRIPS|nr:hypothetical protein T4D_13092 [Trichinella pseudospiralis]